ncbi:cornifelin homolog A-like [Gigantopelta aegis]|uniref:cornifelin homolog A-like n=1 Tax=Gigantopelta aegis TaxID=1735272 RepID=UPI001B8883FF|nr:cornifelin homolog A-like [Gigantopelta aegis]
MSVVCSSYGLGPDQVRFTTRTRQKEDSDDEDKHDYEDCEKLDKKSVQLPLKTPVKAQPKGGQHQCETVVVVSQPMPPTCTQPRAWSTGLCGCCEDISSCCLGCWCPCGLACRVAMDMGESCCAPCCAGILPLRTKLRVQHNIRGSILLDCCVVCWCPCCALCQMAREQTHIKNNTIA